MTEAIGFAIYLLFQFINVFFLAADAVINGMPRRVLVFAFLLYRVPAATPLAFVLGGLLSTPSGVTTETATTPRCQPILFEAGATMGR